MRHIPGSADLVEISIIEWPADSSLAPRLLGRIRDTDLVGEALSRLAEWESFSEGYLKEEGKRP